MCCRRKSNTDPAVYETNVLCTNATMKTAKAPASVKRGPAMMGYAAQLKEIFFCKCAAARHLQEYIKVLQFYACASP